MFQRLTIILALAALAAIVASGASSRATPSSTGGLAAPFASASGSCSSSFDGQWIRAAFPSFASSRENVLARVTSTVPLSRLEAETGDGMLYGMTTVGGADTTWLALQSVPSGFPTTVRAHCYNGTGSISVDLFDTPAAPATFSGSLTPGAAAASTSGLVVRAERGGHYVASLTLAQGALRLSKEEYGAATQDFASSGRFDLGTIKAGTAELYLTALDGPQARWQVEIAREPAAVTHASVAPSAARQGAPLTIHYAVGGDTRVSASVVGPGGAVVRSLGRDFAVSTGEHSLRWDGLDDSGRAVADGRYVIKLSTDEGTAGETAVVLDSTPPLVKLRTPTRIGRSRACVVSVADRTTSLKTAVMRVDGAIVRRLTAGTSSLIYRPTRGWSPGRHAITVDAADAVGNKSRTAFTLSVR